MRTIVLMTALLLATPALAEKGYPADKNPAVRDAAHNVWVNKEAWNADRKAGTCNASCNATYKANEQALKATLKAAKQAAH